MAFAFDTAYFLVGNRGAGPALTLAGTPENGTECLMSTTANATTQKFIGYQVSAYGTTYIRIRPNSYPNYDLNYWTGSANTGKCATWSHSIAAEGDSTIDLNTVDAADNLYRIKLVNRNVFLTSAADGGRAMWSDATNADNQVWKLVTSWAGSGSSGGDGEETTENDDSGSDASHTISLTTVRQLEFTSSFSSGFANAACYASCMLSAARFYAGNTNLTMRDLVNAGCVNGTTSAGLTSAPYFGTNPQGVSSISAACQTIYDEILNNRPVFIKLNNVRSGNTHWVLAKSVTAPTQAAIIVMDPYKGDGSGGTWSLSDLLSYTEGGVIKYHYANEIRKTYRL